MLAGRGARIWAIGGALAAALLLIAGWFLAIGPRYAEADALHQETELASTRVAILKGRLAALERQNAEIDRYRAELRAARRALPTSSGTADFLRELQAAGRAVGASVDGFAAGSPNEIEAAGVAMHALPAAVTATGTAAELDAFLDQLQGVQPRAVLINSAKLDPGADGDTLAGEVQLTLNLQVFVAPVAGAPAPADAAGQAQAAAAPGN